MTRVIRAPDSAQAVEATIKQAEGRDGFALAGALLALVVVGALVTGSFFAASQEQAIGLSSKYGDDALYVAEYGLNQATAATEAGTLKALTGPISLGDYTVTAGGQAIGTASVWVRPVGPDSGYYLFVARGRASNRGRFVGGSRVLGLVTRLINVSFKQDRAMQVYDGIDVQGSAQISGRDTVPTGYSQWDSCAVSGTQNAVVARDTSKVDPQKQNSIIGPIAQDATMDASDFLDYGDVNFDWLKGMATKTYGTATINGLEPFADASGCRTDLTTNWGEPFNVYPACRDYFPIIYASGNLTITGHGRGQGILLVGGDLEVTGGFAFYGITIVKGTISAHGTGTQGGHLYGTVLAFNQGSFSDDPNLAIGNSFVELSSCAVRRAVRAIPGANRAVSVRGHSWIDLTGAGAGF